ncbi:MAG: EF-hand domain-containing protein [Candidatus Margulisbacteria bacterium]|nr:EF-hand domain-containing protein [Candidatus Margulisiibacteriota bacterium]
MSIKIGGNDLFRSRIENVYNKADSNADGSVDQGEFKKLFSELLAEKMTGKGDVSGFDLDKFFSMIDEDQDGAISKEEFTRFIEAQKKMPPPPPMPAGLNMLELFLSGNADDLFAQIDADGDGKITLKELTTYLDKKMEETQANKPMIGNS